MHLSQLEERLRELMAEAARGPDAKPEKELLEAALSVADEWQMRLTEIEGDEEEREPGAIDDDGK